MGYELRRALRVALGPKITGLQRAVALEIADDARDDTRLSYATLEDLVVWTGAKDANVVRNALKRLAVEGWEFRVPLGVGKDGRTLYAVPGKRITFKVPAFTMEGVAGATPLEAEGVAPARSEGAVAHSQGAPARSERAGATPFSSSPQSPHLSSGPSAPETTDPEGTERETEAAPPNPGPTKAQSAVRAANVVPAAEEDAFIAWVTTKHQVRGAGFWVTAAGDIPELAKAWRANAVAVTGHDSPPPVDHCGRCSPDRLVEDEDGNRNICQTCHPNRRTHP